MSLKIIQILHHSPSWTSLNLDDDIYHGWHVQTAQAFQKLRIKDCEIECWLPEKTQKKIIIEKKDNIIYRVFPSLALNYGREFSNPLIKAIRKERQNNIIIHLHGIFNYLTYSIAGLFSNRPIIAQHHGDCPPLYLLQRRKLLYGILPLLEFENFFLTKTLNNIDYFFCLTNECKRTLNKLGISNKSSIQTMGVDFDKFTPAVKIEVKKSLGFTSDSKLMLYAGRLDQYKGSQKIISAFSKLKEQHKLEFIIVGADESDQFYNLAKRNSAKIYSRQSHDNLIKFYQAADVFVLPGSEYYNLWGGIGVSTVESLACNTPVISGTLSNFPEDYHKLGICATTTEQIINGVDYILKYPQEFNQCRETARKYYDWPIIANQTYQLYQQLFLKYYNVQIEKADV